MYIIAEAGINHCGSLIRALDMVDAAKECGANAVKFQCFWQWKDLREFELSRNQFVKIFDYAKHIGIECFATPFSFEAIDFLSTHQTTWKIPSGMITNYPFIKKISETSGVVILSTGMADIDECSAAMDILKGRFVFGLHCTTQYPCRYKDVNLRAMQSLWPIFGKNNVGISDHTMGLEVPVAAAALGAVIIEKHFTLSRKLKGPDQQSSFEPKEFKSMVKVVNNVLAAMGSCEKKPTQTEMIHRDNIRQRMAGKEIEFVGYKDGCAVYNQV